MIKKLLLILAFVNFNMLAAQVPFTDNGIEYQITTPTTVQVIANSQSPYSGSVTIPQSVIYNGTPYAVTSIEGDAFNTCIFLTDITIPNTVTYIGEGAFYSCVSLTNITIPNSVTSIESFTFAECSSLTDITISNSVTYIGESAFYNCYLLTDIIIPNTVTSIGSEAFYSCASLTNITIPNSVTSIGSYAFDNCTGLTSLSIPNSVTSLGIFAFSNCPSLTSLVCAIETPLIIDSSVFSLVNKTTCSLTVPTASLNDYLIAGVWEDFNSIVGSNTLNSPDFFANDNVSLYPNPFTSDLFLEFNNGNEKNVKVINSNGEVVITKRINGLSNSIGTNILSSGIYVVTIKSDEGTITKKVIKN